MENDKLDNNKLKVIFGVLVFAAIATVVALATNAASGVINGFSDKSTLNGVQTVDDPQAEGSSYLSFEAPTAPLTPPPTAPPTEPPVITPPPVSNNDCTIYVDSNSGSDSNNGSSASSAYRSTDKAVAAAQAGSTVCLNGSWNRPSGNAALHISNKNGSSGSPITFRSTNPANRAKFSTGSYTSGHTHGAVKVENSKFIILDNIEATLSMKGVLIESSLDIELKNSKIHNMGQENVHIGLGPNLQLPHSERVIVRGNSISNSGNRPGKTGGRAYSIFGELVYIGNGNHATDKPKDILVINNELFNGTAEAVDVKAGASNVTIDGNHIYNVDTWCAGAVMLQSGSTNTVVKNNRIHDITATGTREGHKQCNGNAIGIRSETTNGAKIQNNLVWDTGQGDIFIRSGNSAISITNNSLLSANPSQDNIFTFDGSASQTQRSGNISIDGKLVGRRVSTSDFSGPTSGNADAGQGAGSGFKLKSGSGGINFNQIF